MIGVRNFQVSADMDEEEFLDRLRLHADDTVDFLGEKRKAERERATCVALLRCLGIQFQVDEIGAAKIQPPDVLFREARFEIREVLDQGRRRHDEWKAEAKRRKMAVSLKALLKRYRPALPIDFRNLVTLITEALGEKAQRYEKECANLDALVYVNLRNSFLDPSSPVHGHEQLTAQGWRSVSILMPPYAHVLHATPRAPSFLAGLVCQPKGEWPDLDGLFVIGNVNSANP